VEAPAAQRSLLDRLRRAGGLEGGLDGVGVEAEGLGVAAYSASWSAAWSALWAASSLSKAALTVASSRFSPVASAVISLA
jgi:hypothetical protein